MHIECLTTPWRALRMEIGAAAVAAGVGAEAGEVSL
jgi:hypothetical protein